MKALKSFIVSIICISCFFLLSLYIVLLNTSQILSKKNVSAIAKSISVQEIIGEDTVKEINKNFEDNGLPEEYLNKLLENEDIKEEVSNFISESANSFLTDGTIEDIDSKKLSEVINKGIDIVVNDARANGIDISDNDIKEVKSEINKNIDEITIEVNKGKDEMVSSLNDNNDLVVVNTILDKFRLLYKNRNWILSIIVILLAFALVLRKDNYAFVGTIESVSRVYGILFFVAGLIMHSLSDALKPELGDAYVLFESSLGLIVRNYIILGGTLFMLSIAFGIIYKNFKKNIIDNNNLIENNPSM